MQSNSPRLIVGAISILLGMALALWMILPPSSPDAPEATPAPTVPTPTRRVFQRPKPATGPSSRSPEPPPVYAPLALGDLPRDEQLATKNAAAAALGAAIASCEPQTPDGLVVIAMVTLDERGLAEMVALDGQARPLDVPALTSCLDRTLWEQDWPEVSGELQLGLQFTGPTD